MAWLVRRWPSASTPPLLTGTNRGPGDSRDGQPVLQGVRPATGDGQATGFVPLPWRTVATQAFTVVLGDDHVGSEPDELGAPRPACAGRSPPRPGSSAGVRWRSPAPGSRRRPSAARRFFLAAFDGLDRGRCVIVLGRHLPELPCRAAHPARRTGFCWRRPRCNAGPRRPGAPRCAGSDAPGQFKPYGAAGQDRGAHG